MEFFIAWLLFKVLGMAALGFLIFVGVGMLFANMD